MMSDTNELSDMLDWAAEDRREKRLNQERRKRARQRVKRLQEAEAKWDSKQASAEVLPLSAHQIEMAMAELDMRSGKISRPSDWVVPDSMAAGDTEMKQETVDRPSHYQIEIGGKAIQVIDLIEAYALNFSMGNALKYLLRAGRKDPLKEAEDLKKAAWYLTREAERIEQRIAKASPQGCVG
jgi:hypothetical protein